MNDLTAELHALKVERARLLHDAWALTDRIAELEPLELKALMNRLKDIGITDKAIAQAIGCSMGTVGRWRLTWRIHYEHREKLQAMLAAIDQANGDSHDSL